MFWLLLVFWTEGLWWNFLGITKRPLSHVQHEHAECTVLSCKNTMLPFCRYYHVPRWPVKTSLGKLTEPCPPGEPSPPPSPFHIWCWNLDSAVGSPRCCTNGSHRLGSHTAGAWLPAKRCKRLPGRCSASMSERASTWCQSRSCRWICPVRWQILTLLQISPYRYLRKTRPSMHTLPLWLTWILFLDHLTPLRTSPAGFHMALINKQCNHSEHSWLLCPKHSCQLLACIN